MNRSSTQKLIVSLALLLLTGAAFAIMVHRVVAQGGQLVEQMEALALQQEQEVSRQQLRSLADNTVNERALVQSHFLTQEGDTINFLDRVESLAIEHGVQLKTNSVRMQEEKGAKGDWVQLDFLLVGSRSKVQDFVTIFENMSYVLRVNSVQLNAQTGGEWEAEIEVWVRILSYD